MSTIIAVVNGKPLREGFIGIPASDNPFPPYALRVVIEDDLTSEVV